MSRYVIEGRTYDRLEVAYDQLRDAINRYLDSDGSRGRFDALALAMAREDLSAALNDESRPKRDGSRGELAAESLRR